MNKNNENRQYKDSVFSDLFYSDRDARKNLMELYNVLYDEKLTDDNEIELVRISNILYGGIHNDSAFTVKNKRIILSEHQSTVNENMPLRDLLYIGTEFERYEAAKDRYKRKRITIPAPDFFTFYNGTEPYPAEKVLKLSDSYETLVEKPNLELYVKTINININAGHEILSKCRVLREYSLFVETVRKFKAEGFQTPIEKAIYECIRNGILEEYLERKGREVRNMLFAEYDHDLEMQVVREEAYEEALEKAREKEKSKIQGMIEILKDLGLSVSEIKTRITQKLNLSEEEVNAYIK